MRLSLKSSVFLGIIICLLISWLGFYLAFKYWAHDNNRSNQDMQLHNALILASALVNVAKDINWQQLAETIAEQSGYRVSFIDRTGRLLGDSSIAQDNFARSENHAARPEIISALQFETTSTLRHSSSLSQGFLYMAQYIGSHQVVLRLAAPASVLYEIHWPWAYIGAIMLAGILLTLLLPLLISKKYKQDLAAFKAALPDLSYGNCTLAWRTTSLWPEIKSLGRQMEETARTIKGKIEYLHQDAGRLKSILQDMLDPVMVINNQGRVSLCNQAMQTLVGNINPIGLLPSVVLRNAQLISMLYQTTLSRQGVRGEIRMLGGKVWEAVLSPIIDNNNKVEVVIILHDITTMKELDTTRRDFVANFSHELRTPVAVIKGAQETMETLDDMNMLKNFLPVIHRQIVRLEYLLESLLNLARLEDPGWGEMESEDIDINNLLLEVKSLLHEKAKMHDVNVNVRLQPATLMVSGEYKTLELALVNLLDNAIKYSSGQVYLEVQVTDSEFSIEVRDDGPGIAPEYHERIFERFFRIDKSRAHPAGSGGLGLSIAKQPVTAAP